MIVKKLTTSRLLNDVQQCTPQWGVQVTERSCDSKMAEFHSDKFAFSPACWVIYSSSSLLCQV